MIEPHPPFDDAGNSIAPTTPSEPVEEGWVTRSRRPAQIPTTPSAMEEAQKIKLGVCICETAYADICPHVSIVRALSERDEQAKKDLANLANESVAMDVYEAIEAQLREREREIAQKDADLETYTKDVDRRMGEREREFAKWQKVLDDRAALYQEEVDALRTQLAAAEQRVADLLREAEYVRSDVARRVHECIRPAAECGNALRRASVIR